jgi:hypothetical protein
VSLTAIASLEPRRRATVAGAIRAVTSYRRPYPRTEVELDDGSGVLLLRFMGRQEVPGLTPGLCLRAEGTPGPERGALVMLNPLYCLGRAG